tara:strand:- start:612 stop:953 length:342 start_codon:yes stop_codon:yes gene_type:complete
MEFTVKAVDGNVEEKSRAQVEETLLKEHKEQFEQKETKDESIDKIDFSNKENSTTEEISVDETKNEETSLPEFTDDDVISYIKKDTIKILIQLMNCLRKKRQTLIYQKMYLRI